MGPAPAYGQPGAFPQDYGVPDASVRRARRRQQDPFESPAPGSNGTAQAFGAQGAPGTVLADPYQSTSARRLPFPPVRPLYFGETGDQAPVLIDERSPDLVEFPRAARRARRGGPRLVEAFRGPRLRARTGWWRRLRSIVFLLVVTVFVALIVAAVLAGIVGGISYGISHAINNK